MKMYLKQLSLEDSEDIFDLVKDVDGTEGGFMIDNPSEAGFYNFLQKRYNESEGIDLKPGRVPQDIYWFYKDDSPVGIIKLRRTLTEHLIKRGGNMGYYIRKDSRRKGYARHMLKLCLKKLRDEGMKRVLITCDEDNLGSQRVIEINGGILEDIIQGTMRYWITL